MVGKDYWAETLGGDCYVTSKPFEPTHYAEVNAPN